MPKTQISAHISNATKEQVERYAEAHGVKKGHLIEEALLHHLQSLRELPAALIIPPRLVVEPETLERVSVHTRARQVAGEPSPVRLPRRG